MTGFRFDDDTAGREWGRRARAAANCPDDTALAAYADRRVEAKVGEAVENALADCRAARCLCLAAIAAARQPAIVRVPAEMQAAACALVAEPGIGRVRRVAQWAAAAAAVVVAAQIGFQLGMATAGYRDQSLAVEDTASASGWVDWTTSADL